MTYDQALAARRQAWATGGSYDIELRGSVFRRTALATRLLVSRRTWESVRQSALPAFWKAPDMEGQRSGDITNRIVRVPAAPGIGLPIDGRRRGKAISPDGWSLQAGDSRTGS